MISSHSLQSVQQRYQPVVETALRESLEKSHNASGMSALDAYYGQMRYHLGWVDASFVPLKGNAGKMLRPLLLLSSYEAAGAWGFVDRTGDDGQEHLQRALPAAVAIELTHNFTLIHDDIEDVR